MSDDLKKVLGTSVRPRNPFRGIYVYNDVQELLEIAFKASKRQSPPLGNVRDNFDKKKKTIIFRFEIFSRELSRRLMDLIRRHPNIDEMHPFYLAALEIYASKDEIKKALGKIYGAAKLIDKFRENYKRELKRVRIIGDDKEARKKAYKHLDKIKREAYGRVSSIVKSLKKELTLIRDTVVKLKKLPDYDPTLKTILVVGPPNTGKSSLVKSVSNAKVEVASYPFTTKNITFGHIKIEEEGFNEILVQIADTPGLFDRPMEKRKPEEKIVIKALSLIPDLIIFMFDASEQTTLDPKSQANIFKHTLNTLKSNIGVIVVFNKMDIADENVVSELTKYLDKLGFKQEEIIKASIINGTGIKEILDQIKRKMFKSKG